PESIEALRGETLAIPSGWTIIEVLRKAEPDITIIEVESVRAALVAVQQGRAFAALDSALILNFTRDQFFLEGITVHGNLDYISQLLSAELHLLVSNTKEPLIALLNKAIDSISGEMRRHLFNRWFSDIGIEQARDNLAIVPHKVMLDMPSNHQSLGQLIKHSLDNKNYYMYTETIDISGGNADYLSIVVPVSKVVGERLSQVMLALWITSAVLLLLLPVAWLLATPVVAPIRKLYEKTQSVKSREFDKVCYLPSIVTEVDELSHALVDMAEAIGEYQRGQRELMESIIQLVAEAIDEKSPYTAGHCARVPELALMLVGAAEESTTPAFKGFAFANKDEYQEFRIAAWLHDCGKITVPEHIVDKATKLETIYNRIHEVRMRFEVLWRDAEIQYLTACQDGSSDENLAHQHLLAERERLQADFAFVAEANIGGEFMSDEDRARLQLIAAKTWVRNFDNTLGLSPIERQRLSEASVTPAIETLLADQPWHIIKREKSHDYYDALGVKMDIPEHLYNLGELYNLSISRGTLTTEDRFKINEHIISTIRMLESLPFPPELARVPRYASTHHETMIGTGYPRRLTADDLSIPERIMVLADIFEALTAADRPYKEAKPLSESIDILYKMVKDNHVDRDVFTLFLTSGVYKHYAERFLSPEQIDEVDIDYYLKDQAGA
ncbi:MAG TPA: HD domain-containing phosphohydrolase, partial [Cellvibrionaceae bacterium]